MNATTTLSIRFLALLLWATCLFGGVLPPAPAMAQQAPNASSPAAPPSASPAAKSPFGLPSPGVQTPPAALPKAGESAGIVDRLYAWVLEKQAEYNRGLVQAVRRFKTDNVFAAAAALAFLSFLYGVFHAVGPGHGKAIISSYVLANAQTARRGVLIAFISSAFQALSAIAIVGVMALIFRASSIQMQTAEAAIERVSYALVTIVGAYLLIAQLRALLTGKPAHSHSHGVGRAHVHDVHGHGHGHGHGHDDHGAHAGHDHHDHAAGEACDDCDHAHLPEPDQLKGEWSWSRALALSFAVGVRPCTGAILVLVFALTQGLLLAGVFATLAMALGTAITVSCLAVLAVVSRDWAASMTDGGGGWITRVHTLAALLGSALVFLLGLLLLWGSLGPARPF